MMRASAPQNMSFGHAIVIQPSLAGYKPNGLKNGWPLPSGLGTSWANECW